MTHRTPYLIFIFALLTITSCEFISNTFKYKETTKVFTEALLHEEYDKCMDLFAVEHESFENTNLDTLRSQLPQFRNLIITNFGEDLEYELISAEKVFSTEAGKGTPPNTTKVLVQIENNETFGVLDFLFDDTSKKILTLNTLNIRQPIPNMIPFWLFGLLAICIPVFNIYVINRIRKSALKRKWLKYLAVIVFNVPTITYSAISGLGFKLLDFQLLLGFSFSFMGYLNSMWAFGIPLGGLYWLWKLRTKATLPQASESTSNNILDDLPEEENFTS